MTNLVNPFRLTAVGPAAQATQLNVPLYQLWGESYYGKCLTAQTAGLFGSDNRTCSGTFAFKMAGTPGNFPRVFEISDDIWDSAAIRWGFAQTTGGMFMTFSNTDHTTLYNASYTATTGSFPTDWCDGTLRRFAFNLDLDDLPNSEWRVCTSAGIVGEGYYSGSGGVNNIPWSSAINYGVLTSATGTELYSGALAGDGVAMYSLSRRNDLNLDAVFDNNGFFTNPGKHWLNWYATRPELAFTSAPYMNQGTFFRLSGRNYCHTPTDTWDYASSTENRHHKAITHPGVIVDCNDGVVY